MDAEISKSNSVSTRLWTKLPFALFMISALILIASLTF